MQNLNVNITPDNYPQSLYYSQNDVGREFKINITDFTIPVGATVKIQATKPSGFGFSVAGTVSGNSVTFETTDEMTDEAGRFPAELVIESGAVVIGTANFLMVGEQNPHPPGTTDGSQGTIIPELTLLVERVEAAASSVLDMQVVAQTLPAGSQASYSYDEDLNKATFGIPEGQAGAGAAGVVASAYSAAKTYKVGDYVLYNSNLYRCTTAITTAEAWTAAHWTQIVLADDVTDLKTDLDNIERELNVFNFEKRYTATQILFTIDDVSIGDVFSYVLDVQAPIGFIGLYTSSDTLISYYAKGSSSQPTGVYSGTFTIPSNFAYAKIGINNGGYVDVTKLESSKNIVSRMSTAETDISANETDISTIKNSIGIINFKAKYTSTEELFTSSLVRVGDVIAYSMNVQAPTAFIRLLDSNGTSLGYYGKGSSSQAMGVYSGTFTIPSGFATAKIIIDNGGYAEMTKLENTTNLLQRMDMAESDIENIRTDLDGFEGYIYKNKVFSVNDELFTNGEVSEGDLLQYKLIATAQLGFIQFFDNNGNSLGYYGKSDSGTPVGTVFSGTIEVPYGFAHCYVKGNNTSTITISKLTKNRELEIITGKRITIKDGTEKFKNSYPYFAFSSGILYQGKEIHATRVGANHYPTGTQTAIQFLIVDEEGNMKTFYPSLPYSTLGETDLRDPNLSTTRDGQYLLLSVFGEVKNGNEYNVTKSYMFVLDSLLDVVATFEVGSTGEATWGNTLQTKDGFLLKCVYVGDDVKLYKSNETFNTTSMTFSLVKTFDHSTIGYNLSEPTIGYVGDNLVLMARSSNANSALIWWSTNEDGDGGWTDTKLLGFDIHSPVMQLYTSGDTFDFGGSLWLGNYKRPPCVGRYNLTDESCQVANIDTSITVSGGYPSMINLGGGLYAMVYYEDYNNTGAYTYGYYRRVNTHRELPSQY